MRNACNGAFLNASVAYSGMKLISFIETELTEQEPDAGRERLKAGGEGGDRGWDGRMASPTQWTWVWASSGGLWRTGEPGVLQPWGRKESDVPQRLNSSKNTSNVTLLTQARTHVYTHARTTLYTPIRAAAQPKDPDARPAQRPAPGHRPPSRCKQRPPPLLPTRSPNPRTHH